MSLNILSPRFAHKQIVGMPVTDKFNRIKVENAQFFKVEIRVKLNQKQKIKIFLIC